MDEKIQDVRAQVDGLATDIKTMHERLDSTVQATNERFDQIDLAQTAARTTLDTIMARLAALDTKLTEVQQSFGGDTEHDDGTGRRSLRCTVPGRLSHYQPAKPLHGYCARIPVSFYHDTHWDAR